MKFYNPEFMKNFIEERKEIIYFAEAGLRENWIATHEPVFIHDKFELDLNDEFVEIDGFVGSSLATPVMIIYYKSGHYEIVECWKRGKKEVDKFLNKFKFKNYFRH